jgi:hypothetical protein
VLPPKTATRKAKTQELLVAQVESREGEQESKGKEKGTPRGICLRVIMLEGP